MGREGSEFPPPATGGGEGRSQGTRAETATAFAIPCLRKGDVGHGVFGYFSFLRSKTAGGAPNKMRDAPFEFPPFPEGDVGGRPVQWIEDVRGLPNLVYTAAGSGCPGEGWAESVARSWNFVEGQSARGRRIGRAGASTAPRVKDGWRRATERMDVDR